MRQVSPTVVALALFRPLVQTPMVLLSRSSRLFLFLFLSPQAKPSQTHQKNCATLFLDGIY
jgi:hypothetical protein